MDEWVLRTFDIGDSYQNLSVKYNFGPCRITTLHEALILSFLDTLISAYQITLIS